MENVIRLLSKQRLESYGNDLNKHFDNLHLIAHITPKIATIEIALRNSADITLSASDPQWIENISDKKLLCDKQKIIDRFKSKSLTHHQFLSNFTLGSIIYIIRLYKIQRKVFDASKINLRRYFAGNKNYYLAQNQSPHIKKIKFKDYQKVNIILSLLSTIRNRSYHWENLSKIIQKDSGQYPRLSVLDKDLKVMTAIEANRIEVFLDDILACIEPQFRCLLQCRS